MRIQFSLSIDLVKLLSSLKMETLVGSSEVALSLLWNSNPYITKRTMLLYKNPPIATAMCAATAMDSLCLKNLVKRKATASRWLPSHMAAGVPPFKSESILSPVMMGLAGIL